MKQTTVPDVGKRLAAKLSGGPDLFGDFSGGLTISGLSVDGPSMGGGVALKEFKFSGEGTKVGEPQFDFALRFSEDGLAIRGDRDPEAAKLIKVLPESARLNLIVTALPKEALVRAVLGYLGTVVAAAATQPQSAELYAMMALSRYGDDLLQGMGAAGTVLKLVDTAYVAPIVAVDIEADFKVDPTTAYGLVGALTIAVVGLDEVIALYEEDHSGSKELTRIEALKAASRRTRAANGVVTDIFVVQVAADGAVTVNGRPYESLLGSK